MATSSAEPKTSPQVPPGDEAGYPPPEYVENLPEGTVLSPAGVTRPPDEVLIDAYRKERSKDKQIAGKVLVKGKTHHGFAYERIVEVNQPRTEKGMFQIFKAHFPDAVDEDFSAEAISDEDAEKLQKEWTNELLGKQREEEERQRKAYEGSASAARKEQKEQEDYDALTVAELKERSGTRGIDHRHDWTKDDYVKALKKADKNG